MPHTAKNPHGRTTREKNEENSRNEHGRECDEAAYGGVGHERVALASKPPRQPKKKQAVKTASHQQLLYDAAPDFAVQQPWSPMSVEESQPMTPLTCYTNDIDVD
jgi:hypothetical protein